MNKSSKILLSFVFCLCVILQSFPSEAVPNSQIAIMCRAYELGRKPVTKREIKTVTSKNVHSFVPPAQPVLSLSSVQSITGRALSKLKAAVKPELRALRQAPAQQVIYNLADFNEFERLQWLAGNRNVPLTPFLAAVYEGKGKEITPQMIKQQTEAPEGASPSFSQVQDPLQVAELSGIEFEQAIQRALEIQNIREETFPPVRDFETTTGGKRFLKTVKDTLRIGNRKRRDSDESGQSSLGTTGTTSTSTQSVPGSSALNVTDIAKLDLNQLVAFSRIYYIMSQTHENIDTPMGFENRASEAMKSRKDAQGTVNDLVKQITGDFERQSGEFPDRVDAKKVEKYTENFFIFEKPGGQNQQDQLAMAFNPELGVFASQIQFANNYLEKNQAEVFYQKEAVRRMINHAKDPVFGYAELGHLAKALQANYDLVQGYFKNESDITSESVLNLLTEKDSKFIKDKRLFKEIKRELDLVESSLQQESLTTRKLLIAASNLVEGSRNFSQAGNHMIQERLSALEKINKMPVNESSKLMLEKELESVGLLLNLTSPLPIKVGNDLHYGYIQEVGIAIKEALLKKYGEQANPFIERLVTNDTIREISTDWYHQNCVNDYARGLEKKSPTKR